MHLQICHLSIEFSTVITFMISLSLMDNLDMNHQTGWFSDIFSTWNTCPFNPILCVKFLPHLSYLYFSKSFMDIFHMHFKIFLSNNFFSTNFTFEFCKFSKCQSCSYAWGWVLSFSISWTFCYVISS